VVKCVGLSAFTVNCELDRGPLVDKNGAGFSAVLTCSHDERLYIGQDSPLPVLYPLSIYDLHAVMQRYITSAVKTVRLNKITGLERCNPYQNTHMSCLQIVNY
jgi:hypothetical protein